jgi:hypothetical protein
LPSTSCLVCTMAPPKIMPSFVVPSSFMLGA